MNLQQTPANPYQHHGAHYPQNSQPLQQPPPVPGFTPGFVAYPQQYFGQQGPPRGLNATYPATTAPNYHTAPPNALRYRQQFNLPVHNGVPIQRPQPHPQSQPQPHPQLPRAPPPIPQPELAPAESSSIAQIGKPDKHLKGLKCIPEPPDKEPWRHRLFDVDGLMILTEEQ
jgi:hypothetical protein